MNSYFQSYFQASSMPKRLLQFVLSRLEILETDTLDLENLNVAWGKNSTIEFKNVELRVKKLNTLLHLPTYLVLSKACILLLRLTVPVDIYSSPILIEVDGLDFRLQVKTQDDEISSHSKSKSDWQQKQRFRPTEDSAKAKDSFSHTSNEEMEEKDLPSVADLAQSFLQTELEEGKTKLEAALSSERKELGTEWVSSDDGDILTGTGTSLTVPKFMARFLQGIIDRLQVKIQNVNISFNFNVANGVSEILPPLEVKKSLILRLVIQNIIIEGVTNVPKNIGLASYIPESGSRPGKRLIYLSEIRGYLISDANSFSSLTRSPVLSQSSTACLNPISNVSQTVDETSLSSLKVDNSSITDLPNLTNDLRSNRSSISSTNSEDRDVTPKDKDLSNINASFEEMNEDLPSKSSHINQAAEKDPRFKEEQKSSVLQYSFGDSSSKKNAFSSISTTYNSSPTKDFAAEAFSSSKIWGAKSQSPRLPLQPISKLSQHRISQSHSSLSESLHCEPQFDKELDSKLSDHEQISEEDSPHEGASPGSVFEEDLTQSKLFSHEEAESMYMSAISHESIQNRIFETQTSSSSSSNLVKTPNRAFMTLTEENTENVRRSNVVNIEALSAKIASSNMTPRGHTPYVLSNDSDIPGASAIEFNRPSTMSSRIFKLDRIQLYIPSALSDNSTVNPEFELLSTFSSSNSGTLSESASLNVPGAFSTLSENQTISVKTRSPTESGETEAKLKSKMYGIEINFGNLIIQFDAVVGKLILKLIAQITEIIRSNSSTGVSLDQKLRADSIFELNAEKISLKFLDHLENLVTTPLETQNLEPNNSDILLQTSFTGLQMKSQTSGLQTETSISLKNFVFGYEEESIVSFDGDQHQKGSMQDLNTPIVSDISVNIKQTAEITRLEVSTLPLHVSINLQKLDETFSWFGGLGSVLSLGSSIVSNKTITASSPNKSKARGVRFETPLQTEALLTKANKKANIRIGGLKLDLKGSECGLRLETSAVKTVIRDEGIGISIQNVQLSAPLLYQSPCSSAILMEVFSTRVEFLSSPKDADLDRLLSLITPSRTKYGHTDDILLDTLLRQRNKGPVLRLTIDHLKTHIERLSDLTYLPDLSEEVSRLATVANYLPDDDNPGLLSLILVRKLDCIFDSGYELGILSLTATEIEAAHVNLPALLAVSIGNFSVLRNKDERILGLALDPDLNESSVKEPVVMARIIGNEMEPVIRIKLSNLNLEYRVPTILNLLEFIESCFSQEVSASISASVAILTRLSLDSTSFSSTVQARKFLGNPTKQFAIAIDLRHCVLGLNPLGLPSKIAFVLSEACFGATISDDPSTKNTFDIELKKASILVVDNVENLTRVESVSGRVRSFDGSSQVAYLCGIGYVSVGFISSARATFHMMKSGEERTLHVEIRDDLLVLESCADSTQTLIAVVNGLIPPTQPPCKDIKYRTKVIPIQDLLASLSTDAFGTAEGDYNFDDDFGLIDEFEDDLPCDFDDDKDSSSDAQYNYCKTDNTVDKTGSPDIFSRDTQDGVLLESLLEPSESEDNAELEILENHFGRGSILDGPDHRWDSANNKYERLNSAKVLRIPLKVCVRDVHVIWNLFDGYDWQHTRDTITKAVQNVESKVSERRARVEKGPLEPTFDGDDEASVIEDFLFNSIYIGVPASKDPHDLASAINRDLNDNATETESIVSTTYPSTIKSASTRIPRASRLQLNRSRHHKITFELQGVYADFVVFPPESGETQSSLDIRVRDFDIFDHVPTSTWRKFATYMQDAGERETGSSMIHIEILNVKPVADLAASEIVLKATVLPLRLHVDQDALDFITRFFEFKDDQVPARASNSEEPFLQRVEVNSIKIRLDFKPKRVNYAGLRSGHTTEFMNFLILDEADMELRHTIIYGISGFEKLGKCLNDIWMPDVKRNQLPGILAGLAPVKSLVNVSGGFRHLIVVPMREYKKDGRIVRSISKGAAAFAKVTSTELVKLGAKVAVGVQTVLQGAEGLLSNASDSPILTRNYTVEEEQKQISLYANQPIGVLQGLRGGYDGLQRDLIIARNAVIAVPGEIIESGTAVGALKAVGKYAPTVILRPAIGVAKAGGQILMGATNSLDPINLQRAEAKYKKH